MFCKHCGDHIDRKTMRCTNCGKEAWTLEGGIGFWDLASGPKSETPSSPRVSISTERIERLISENTEKTGRGLDHIHKRQSIVNKKQTVLLALIAALLVISVFVDILLLVTANNIRREFAESPGETQLTETTETTANAEPIEDTGAVSDEIKSETSEQYYSGAETDATDSPNTMSTVDMKIVPGRGPTSDGIGLNECGMVVFTARASGSDLVFEWAKWVDNEWIPVDVVHPEMFRIEGPYPNIDEGNPAQMISKLRLIKECTMDITGRYRCVVRNGYDSYDFGDVDLTVEIDQD